MNSGMANLMLRTIRMAPVMICMFAGCTCSRNPAVVATPTAAVRPTDTVPAATATTAPATATVAAATPTSVPTPDTLSPAVCEAYVAVLAGRAQDAAVLDNPRVRAIAHEVPDLVVCGAVARDSDELCEKMMPAEQGPGGACRQTRAIFHELRTYPKGRSFMFDNLDWEGCNQLGVVPTTVCDAFREAVRAADVKKCAAIGDGQSICRALINLDKSLCRAQGKLAGLGVEEGCKKAIESRAFLARGLKAVSESGPPRERELAKAALGQPDACAPFVRTAMDLCTRNPAAASGSGAPPPAAGDSAAPSGTVAPSGSSPGNAPQG